MPLVCEDGGMRAVLAGVLLVVGLGSSCSKNAAAAVRSDGTLILQVGGGESSIRAALAAAGVTIGPPQRLRSPEVEPDPVPVPVPAPSHGDPSHENPAPRPNDGPVEPPKVDPVPPKPHVPQPTWKTVKLRRGQTLIHLAKEHLGNGNRFRDILQLNGWTEAQARRLSEGQEVKVPIDKAGKARRE